MSVYTVTYNPSCTSHIQELLLKDLPDPSRARRYSRRPSLNKASFPNGYGLGKCENVIHLVDGSCSQMGGYPSKNDSRERPKVVVEGLSAAWEKGEVSMHTYTVTQCMNALLIVSQMSC